MTSSIVAADLFCGAGGSSTGLTLAAESIGLGLDLTAVNHWDRAIETHSANHPGARHLCHGLDGVDPRKVIGRKLDLLIASPECTHHSNARGGKPCEDQSRSTAWHVIRWADALRPRFVLVENVREFQSWGPLSEKGKPLVKRKGETFQAWVQALRSLGYVVDWRVLNAADYGAATSRQRLFVMARRGRGSIPWPDPTHAREPVADLFGRRERWRAAREVIDWALPCPAIADRKRPLSAATAMKIESGVGRDQPFLVPYNRTSTICSVEEPLRTLTTRDRFGLAVPSPGRPVGFRMLQPHEMAAAMGFPKGYRFSGSKKEVVRQIGNAVEVGQARALCGAILRAMQGVVSDGR